MSAGILGCHKLGCVGTQTSGRQRLGMELNILPHTGQQPQQRNIHPEMSAEAEKSYSLSNYRLKVVIIGLKSPS